MTDPPRTHHTVDVVLRRQLVQPVVAAEDQPRACRGRRTRRRSAGAIRGSATPTAAYVGWAGLVSGPSALNAVPTPSPLRAAAACRIAGWNALGEAEGDAGLGGDLGHPLGRQGEADAEGLEDVGRARRPRTRRGCRA